MHGFVAILMAQGFGRYRRRRNRRQLLPVVFKLCASLALGRRLFQGCCSLHKTAELLVEWFRLPARERHPLLDTGTARALPRLMLVTRTRASWCPQQPQPSASRRRTPSTAFAQIPASTKGAMVPERRVVFKRAARVSSAELLLWHSPRRCAGMMRAQALYLPRFISTPTRPVGLTICRIERPRLYFRPF